MPFNYRDKSNLADRLRGKSGEEILNELKSDLDTQGRRMFFDSPSWRTRHNNSAFPRGFPFDDDRNRINIRTYLDEIASRHPEFADQLKERPWGEDFGGPSFPRTENPAGECRSEGKNSESEAVGTSKQPEAQEPRQNLSNFGLRNTVPLGPRACGEQEQRQRSMSAPPENSGTSRRFVTKCEIPVMNNPMQDSVQMKPDLTGKGPQEPNLQKPNNAPNVRVIPIQVEGRDTPLLNTNVDLSANFGTESFTEPTFEGRLPRDFGSYQRHSPRFAHKERAATPPQYPSNMQYQSYVPPSQQHFAPPEQQSFTHQQQRPQKPPAPPPTHHHYHHQQQQPPSEQPSQTQPQPNQRQQGDETDSRLPPQPKTEPIKDPILKVQAIQKEVEELMREVEAFQGSSRKDKQYLMLDELLTRQLLLLDNIDTEGKDSVRQARKDTIRSIQRCISTLENKVPALESCESASESKAEENDEGKAARLTETSQPMDVDNAKENVPAGNKQDSQKMDVDEAASGHPRPEDRQEARQEEERPEPKKPETEENI